MAESGSDGSGAGPADASAGERTAPGADAGAPSRADAVVEAGTRDSLLDWRSALPGTYQDASGKYQPLRNAPIIGRHTTIEAAAKSLIAQDEMIGRGLFLPKEAPDTDEYRTGMQKVYDKLGRPAKPEEYTFTAPEGKNLDKDVESRWKAAFHQAGLSQAQANEVLAEYWRTVQYSEQVIAGREAESYREGRNKLFGEFGAATEQMIAQARAFFEHMGAGAFGGAAGQAAWQQLMDAKLPDGSAIKNSPEIIAAFAEAGKRLGEGEFLDSPYYQAGQSTMELMLTRHKVLQDKRFSPEGLTPDEQAEMLRINTQIVNARDRQATGRR